MERDMEQNGSQIPCISIQLSCPKKKNISIHVKKIKITEQQISAHPRNTKIKAKPNYLITTH